MPAMFRPYPEVPENPASVNARRPDRHQHAARLCGNDFH